MVVILGISQIRFSFITKNQQKQYKQSICPPPFFFIISTENISPPHLRSNALKLLSNTHKKRKHHTNNINIALRPIIWFSTTIHPHKIHIQFFLSEIHFNRSIFLNISSSKHTSNTLILQFKQILLDSSDVFFSCSSRFRSLIIGYTSKNNIILFDLQYGSTKYSNHHLQSIVCSSATQIVIVAPVDQLFLQEHPSSISSLHH